MRISRRTFLATVGGAAVGAAGLQVFGQSPQETRAILAEWSNHEEEFRVSVCRQCPGGCGILVRVVDGRVVRISGNPLYPVNHGGLCMKGLAGVGTLYDPDRIRTPLKRTGPRGSGQWQPIEWDEALRTVAGQLQDLRQAGRSHTVAVLGGQYRGLVDTMWQRFCQAYGTPNYLRYRCLAPEQAAPTHYYMQGLRTPLSYDLHNAAFILSFGCNLLESWQSTVNQIWSYGQVRRLEEGKRAQLVQVDTRFSVTAAKSDQWVPILPGTDGALALGLAHVIIQEGLYDQDFVQESTTGFLDWKDAAGRVHRGFRTLVLEDYPPEQVATLTGVPAQQVFSLARRFATHRPALALGERGPPFHAGDLYTRMAIHSLNALVGNIGREGGLLLQGHLPLSAWPALAQDKRARAGTAQPRVDRSNNPVPSTQADLSGLAANLASGEPYGLNLLFLYHTNPLFSLPKGQEWQRALERIPQVVSFSPFMDETTLHADLVLPDSTYLERWQDDEVTHLAGVTLFGVGQPVVPPLYQTRQTEDVILQLAAQVGAPLADALPWETFEDLLRDKAQGLFKAERGHIVMPPQDEDFEAIMARHGYWGRQFESFDAFWRTLVDKGAWWDPNDTFVGPGQLFRTPSGKFEFYSTLLRKEFEHKARQVVKEARLPGPAAADLLARLINLKAQGDMLYLPHFEEAEPTASPEAYPYTLNIYKLMSQPGGRGANQPRLQEYIAVHLEGGWENWVEINPEVAARLEIGEGDWVWLESTQGRIRVRARLFPGAMPEVVNMPFGQGHWAYGHWAQGRGENPNSILVQLTDPFRGMPVWGASRVQLRKA